MRDLDAKVESGLQTPTRNCYSFTRNESYFTWRWKGFVTPSTCLYQIQEMHELDINFGQGYKP